MTEPISPWLEYMLGGACVCCGLTMIVMAVDVIRGWFHRE